MKFIHTADVHWGAVPDRGMPWSEKRAQDIKDSFAGMIKKAGAWQADLLLIAGDLFHQQPLLRDLKEANYLFSTIPDTKVVLIAGNHDCILPSSHYQHFEWNPNVYFLKDEAMASVYFSDINTEVHGCSYHEREIKAPIYDGLKAPNDGRFHILLAHGGDEKHAPISPAALRASGFHYIALGHIHKPGVLAENRIAYPGSLEPLSKTETGRHGYLLGETNGSKVSLSRAASARAQYIPLLVNITPATTNGELAMRLADAIEKRGREHIYRFRLQGYRDPDILFDADYLAGLGNVVEILDETEPEYDFNRLAMEHSGDLIGFYINALNVPDMGELEKKALNYGIDALLNTTGGRKAAPRAEAAGSERNGDGL